VGYSTSRERQGGGGREGRREGGRYGQYLEDAEDAVAGRSRLDAYVQNGAERFLLLNSNTEKPGMRRGGRGRR
jgi:hypothetical protein